MLDETPRYLVVPDGWDPAPFRDRLGPLEPMEEVAPGRLLGTDEGGEEALEPGWVFLPPAVASASLRELVLALAERHGAWSPLLLEEGKRGGGIVAVPLCPGFPEELETAGGWIDGDEVERGLLSFRVLLGILSRVRHDLNNPLTAALAELQLLQMDATPGSEEEASLEAVGLQLRRVGDLVTELAVLRPPRRGGPAGGGDA